MQKTAPLQGAFLLYEVLLFNFSTGEFALRQTQSVSVAVAVELRFIDRATGSDLKSSRGESKSSMDSRSESESSTGTLPEVKGSVS
ncbi:MAG: hypothetical protein C0623_02075 [Desulfuromonas sp.]|nr:MAG: hypothetical protein C0623_02075 [Desulfuromonas sp.]